MRILVTDANERSALAVIRSLGRAGHEVLAGADRRGSLGATSRYSARQVILPDALSAPDAFGDNVVTVAAEHRIDIVIPMTDRSMTPILERARELRENGASVPFPDLDSYAAISDKERLLRVAGELGFAVPGQRTLETPTANRSGLAYPVVIKPSRSVVETADGLVQTRVAYAATEEELDGALAELPAGAYPVLIQERIVGDGVGVFLLRWNERILAAFAHRRIREKPPSGGVSVLRESHPLDPALYERSVALLERHDWRGPAMVELKVERRTGEAYVMEVNGRYWGSLQLAIDAGVDFPALHVAAATGKNPEPVLDYPVGVRTRWTLGDLDHLLIRLRGSRDALGLPPSAPGRGKALLDFLRAFGPVTNGEIFRWYDPRPGVVEISQWLKTLQ